MSNFDRGVRAGIDALDQYFRDAESNCIVGEYQEGQHGAKWVRLTDDDLASYRNSAWFDATQTERDRIYEEGWDDLAQGIEEELELGGDTSTIIGTIRGFLERGGKLPLASTESDEPVCGEGGCMLAPHDVDVMHDWDGP